jgi:hypothetical protein
MSKKFAQVTTGLLAFTLAAVAFAASGANSKAEPDNAASEQSDRPAVLHFADLHGIRHWETADNGKSLLIEGRNRRWYKATFYAPCLGLRYTATLGFITDRSGDLDRFGAVIADDDQPCRFKTFEQVEAPDKQDANS